MTTAPRDRAPDRAPDPLHGVTLERMLTEMVAHFGWEVMGQRIKVRCFTSDPSIPSSLRFLRRTPWARERVESMYQYMLREQARRRRAAGATPDATPDAKPDAKPADVADMIDEAAGPGPGAD